MKCSLVSLIFLKRSLVFHILLFSSLSLHWSLRKAFLSSLAILWNSAFRLIYLSFSLLPFTSLLFSATFKASSDSHFAFFPFLFLETGQKQIEFYQENALVTENPSYNNTREDSTHGHHQMVNTEIRLIIFLAAKDGEALYSQQKQDQELTVAQIMNSLLPNSGLNWSRENH